MLVLTWNGTRPAAKGTPTCLLGGERGLDDRVAAGIHALWHWDGSRLEASTDLFGFQPLFYAVSGTTLWLSPSIPELVRQGAPTELDDAALAVFLRLGTFLGEDTPFRHVRAVPPAARLTWEAGRLRVEGARTQPARRDLRRDAAIDGYVEVFRAAVARHPVDPARTLVPLSGGRDSRHILLELHAAGVRVPCVTVQPAPPKSDEDVRVAAAVAAAVGVPHTVLETTQDRFADEMEKNLRTSLCVQEHFWVMPLVRHVTGRDLVLYDGIAGDTLSEAKYMNAHRLGRFRRNELRQLAEEELETEGYLPLLLRREMYQRLARGLALERLEAELRTHVDAPNPVGSYRFWNRTRRAVAPAPFALLAPVATVRAPFLDPEVYDFLASLPGELLVDRTFHSTAIARAYPAFARLPYEDPQAPPRPAAAHLRQFGIATLRREVLRPVRSREQRMRSLLRHGPYTARLAALLAAPGHVENAGSLATLGLYLSQLEQLVIQA
ncbi:MAG TPA: asparagine synthase-related protein [Gemmatimonadaceae bacterium]|nr:asparagine synthase-related protein [Gemmatimonadaceae bacterium]